MSQEYREHLLDLAKARRHHASMPDASFVRHEINATCGDQLCLYVKISNQQVIECLTFTGHGCIISQASATALCDKLPGFTVLDGLDVKIEPEELLGCQISPLRLNCSLLPVIAFRRGLALWQKDLSSKI